MAAPPQDVKFVRFLNPDEYATVNVDCLAAQGFTATVTFDGGIDFGDYPGEQTPALLEATFRCAVQYPVHPKYSQPHTEEQIRVMYEYYKDELVPCLNREGYSVPPTDVPTWETFLASYSSKDGGWVPYSVVTEREKQLREANGGVVPPEWPAEWERINKACRQGPSVDRLFPEDK
jgi:hypothetical protein